MAVNGLTAFASREHNMHPILETSGAVVTLLMRSVGRTISRRQAAPPPRFVDTFSDGWPSLRNRRRVQNDAYAQLRDRLSDELRHLLLQAEIQWGRAELEERDVFIDELARHFPGLAPAIRHIACVHLFERWTNDVGRCCEPEATSGRVPTDHVGPEDGLTERRKSLVDALLAIRQRAREFGIAMPFVHIDGASNEQLAEDIRHIEYLIKREIGEEGGVPWPGLRAG